MLAHPSRLLVVLVLAACSSGSTRTVDEPARTAAPVPGLLATVNGRALTEADVRVATHAPASGHGDSDAGSPDPAQRRNVLETLIRDELIAQRAEELGLDRDGEYQAEMAGRRAQLEAFRRSRLLDLYDRHERQSASVSEADARRYFDANASRLRTEVHVWQILLRDELRTYQAHRQILSGAPFEQVARGLYPGLPADQAPWDLGFLRWNQVPDAWRSVIYDMSPGETSDVIPGPRSRYWIVRLVAKRQDPLVSFESSQAMIREILREERLQAARTRAGQELRRGARIVYARRAEPVTRTTPPTPR